MTGSEIGAAGWAGAHLGRDRLPEKGRRTGWDCREGRGGRGEGKEELGGVK